MKLPIAIFFVATSFATISARAAASYDDEAADYIGYDSIVEDLQKQTIKTSKPVQAAPAKTGADPFENVWIHAGVGFAQSTQTLSLPNGLEAQVAGRGVQAAVGIDILGPALSAEGAVRSFGESENTNSKVSLKEFDLKLLYRYRRSGVSVRAGGGLSARYMTVHSGAQTYDVTTPASVLTIGGDLYLTPSVSIGLDLGTRNAMITETFDRASYDGTIRLDTHF